MKRWNLCLIVALMVLIGGLTMPLAAERDADVKDKPAKKEKNHADKPDKQAKARADKPEKQKKDRPAKVRGSWNKLDLSEDQAAKIAAIQTQTREKIEQLKKAEHEQILAVLNADQRDRIDKMEQVRRAKMSVGGMKGALARMEKKLDATREALAKAREAGKQDKIDMLEKELTEQEAKVNDYRAKVKEAEANIGDDDQRDKD